MTLAHPCLFSSSIGSLEMHGCHWVWAQMTVVRASRVSGRVTHSIYNYLFATPLPFVKTKICHNLYILVHPPLRYRWRRTQLSYTALPYSLQAHLSLHSFPLLGRRRRKKEVPCSLPSGYTFYTFYSVENPRGLGTFWGKNILAPLLY